MIELLVQSLTHTYHTVVEEFLTHFELFVVFMVWEIYTHRAKIKLKMKMTPKKVPAPDLYPFREHRD